ncbi:MAG: FixH family protein [Syntrophorhabdales bacterium]|jgi:hypothetical protein
MRKLTIIIAMLLLVVGVVYGATTITKKAGEYTIDVTIDRNPPTAGKNNVDITVKDRMGTTVSDAKVLVEYSMPAMPGMPPAHYKTDAVLKGERYRAVIEPSMAGPWNVAIKVIRAGKTDTAKLTLDVK